VACALKQQAGGKGEMAMRVLLVGVVLAVLAGVAWFFGAPAQAAMKPGDAAPDFTLQAAVGGKTFTFSLAEALKKGPVVLYFYPKSFTPGCTAEAHDFAENAKNFADAGASLIGVSADTIKTQVEFSSRECRDKFPVGADPDARVIRSYDALMLDVGAMAFSSRISYVIAPDGKIIMAYKDSSPEPHIEKTLAAVRQWRAEHPK
jgi:peroxiredoxin